MNQYYCHQCAISNGLVVPANPNTLTGTSYQLGKFIKHTAPTGTYPLNSVFDDPTYDTYSRYIVSGTASGLLEIDDLGRKNFVWFAGQRTGAEYQNGVFIAPASGVKIVLPEDYTKLHAFPITTSPGSISNCVSCGKILPLW
jgi:hypothetical protein